VSRTEGNLGEVDPEELLKVQRRASASHLDGYVATVLAIKANQAIVKGETAGNQSRRL